MSRSGRLNSISRMRSFGGGQGCEQGTLICWTDKAVVAQVNTPDSGTVHLSHTHQKSGSWHETICEVNGSLKSIAFGRNLKSRN